MSEFYGKEKENPVVKKDTMSSFFHTPASFDGAEDDKRDEFKTLNAEESVSAEPIVEEAKVFETVSAENIEPEKTEFVENVTNIEAEVPNLNPVPQPAGVTSALGDTGVQETVTAIYVDENAHKKPKYTGAPGYDGEIYTAVYVEDEPKKEDEHSYRYKRGDDYPVVVSAFKEKVRHAKKEKKKSAPTWVVAMASAIAGALIFSVVSPLMTSLTQNITKRDNGGHNRDFSLNIVEGEKPNSNAQNVTYDSENRKVLSTVEIGHLVGPSVVGIVSQVQYQGFFREEVASGSGSGIVFTKDGYIVTNHHVIDGAQSVKVVLNTGKEYDAKLIGSDEKTDLAVIKIEANDLTEAVFGDSTNLQAGEKVVAIGNPLGLEFAGTLTQGIISAVNRTVTVDGRAYKMIQTDAAINPGNSGGALVNEYGEVIGINSVKVSSSGVEGLGFAIPVSDAKPIIDDLVKFGYVKGRPLIGLTVRYVSEQEAYYYNLPAKGLFVVEVTAGTGAEKAGVQKGDVILSCDGKEVTSSEALNEIRDTHKAGETLTLKINRNGNIMDVQITLGEDTTKAQ